MLKSDIIFWSSTFIAFSFMIIFSFGIRQMFLCWGIFLIMGLLFKFMFLYKKILQKMFDWKWIAQNAGWWCHLTEINMSVSYVDIHKMKTKEVKFTKKDYEELLNTFTKDYMKLVKWLFENHPKVWRQYEDKKMGGKRIMFLKKL